MHLSVTMRRLMLVWFAIAISGQALLSGAMTSAHAAGQQANNAVHAGHLAQHGKHSGDDATDKTLACLQWCLSGATCGSSGLFAHQPVVLAIRSAETRQPISPTQSDRRGRLIGLDPPPPRSI